MVLSTLSYIICDASVEMSSQIYHDLEENNLSVCRQDSCKNLNRGSKSPDYRSCYCDKQCKFYKNCCYDALHLQEYDQEQQEDKAEVEIGTSCRKFHGYLERYVVSRCSSNYSENSELIELCHMALNITETPLFGLGDDDLFDTFNHIRTVNIVDALSNIDKKDPLIVLPVLSRNNGVIFNNVYCALCNGLQEQDVHLSPFKLKCPEPPDRTGKLFEKSISVHNKKLIVDIDKSMWSSDSMKEKLYLNISFNPFNSSSLWSIYLNGRTYDCELILDDTEDVFHEHACTSAVRQCDPHQNSSKSSIYCPAYSSLVADKSGRIFQNPHCAMCNNNQDELSCVSESEIEGFEQIQFQAGGLDIILHTYSACHQISIVLLCVHLLTFCVHREMRELAGKLIAWFVLCLFLFHLSTYLIELDEVNCKTYRLLAYIAYIAVLAWTNVISYYAYSNQRYGSVVECAVSENNNRRYLVYLLFVSAVTILMAVLFILISEFAGQSDWKMEHNCFSYDTWFVLLLSYAPWLLSMTGSLGCFLATVVAARKQNNNSNVRFLGQNKTTLSSAYWFVVLSVVVIWPQVYLEYLLANMWFRLVFKFLLFAQVVYIFTAFTFRPVLLIKLKQYFCLGKKFNVANNSKNLESCQVEVDKQVTDVFNQISLNDVTHYYESANAEGTNTWELCNNTVNGSRDPALRSEMIPQIDEYGEVHSTRHSIKL